MTAINAIPALTKTIELLAPASTGAVPQLDTLQTARSAATEAVDVLQRSVDRPANSLEAKAAGLALADARQGLQQLGFVTMMHTPGIIKPAVAHSPAQYAAMLVEAKQQFIAARAALIAE